VGLIVVLLAGLVLSACGGKDAPPRSALVEQLAQLCLQARADTEKLGLPGDKGFAVMEPTAAIGVRLAKSVRRLQGTTAREKAQLRSLAKNLEYYYKEMQAGIKLYRIKQPQAYVITMDRAKATLVSAEALATRMGAPECAVRPFADS
jgi:hypothetical protein